MFDLINGIPVHPLVVHAIVVLLPLAAVGTIAIVVRPSWRPRYGLLVVAAAAGAAILLPVATSSGEELERRVGDPGEHAELGEQLIWFAIPLVVLSAALVFLDRRQRRDLDTLGTHAALPGGRTASMAGTAWPITLVAVLAVVAAVATGVQVYRVGDSGARAAWEDVPAQSVGQIGR